MSCERARSGEVGHESLVIGGQEEREQEVYIVVSFNVGVCGSVFRISRLSIRRGLRRYEV